MSVMPHACLYCGEPCLLMLACESCVEAHRMMDPDGWFERLVKLAESRHPDVDFRVQKTAKKRRTKWGESGDLHVFRQEKAVG